MIPTQKRNPQRTTVWMQAGKPLLSHSATPECGRQASKIPATPSLLGKPQIAVQCSHAPFLLSMHYTPSAPLSRNTHTYGTGSKKPMIFMWFTSSASLPSPSWVCSLSLTQSGVCLRGLVQPQGCTPWHCWMEAPLPLLCVQKQAAGSEQGVR